MLWYDISVLFCCDVTTFVNTIFYCSEIQTESQKKIEYPFFDNHGVIFFLFDVTVSFFLVWRQKIISVLVLTIY